MSLPPKGPVDRASEGNLCLGGPLGGPHPSLRTAIELTSEQQRLEWQVNGFLATQQTTLQALLHDQQEASRREAVQRHEQLELQIARVGDLMGKQLAGWHEDMVTVMTSKFKDVMDMVTLKSKEQEKRAEAIHLETAEALLKLSTLTRSLSIAPFSLEHELAPGMSRMSVERLLDEQVVSKISKTCDDRLSALHKQHIRMVDELVSQVERLGSAGINGMSATTADGHAIATAPATQLAGPGPPKREVEEKKDQGGLAKDIGGGSSTFTKSLCEARLPGGAGQSSSSLSRSKQEEQKDQKGVNVQMLKAVHGWSRKKTPRTTVDPHMERFKSAFEIVSSIIILINLVFMGVETDISMSAVMRGEEAPSWLYYGNVAFMGLFTLELLCRIAMERLDFFMGEHRRWNFMDAVLVLFQIVDVAFAFVNLGFVRALRAVRSVRGVRVIKTVTYVRELRLMIAALSCSLYSLMWSFVLLLLALYLFALGLEQALTTSIEGSGLKSMHSDFVDLYGSLGSAMISLFMAISGGSDWSDLAAPLVEYSKAYLIFFMCFITFTVFGMLNILTAVFVESTNRISEVDAELVIQEHMDKESSVIGKIRRFLTIADTDNSGTISKREFDMNLADSRFEAQLKLLDLEAVEAEGVFRILNVHETDEVDIEEFIYGLMRLKGNAKAVDVITMLYESKRISRRLMAFMKWTEDSFTELRSSLGLQRTAAAALNTYLTEPRPSRGMTRSFERDLEFPK